MRAGVEVRRRSCGAVNDGSWCPWGPVGGGLSDRHFEGGGLKTRYRQFKPTRSDSRFFLESNGMRTHQVRLEGGDASSDSYCYA